MRDAFMLLDNSWLQDVFVFEVFKVYAGYEI